MADKRLILPDAMAAQITQACWLISRHPTFGVAWGSPTGVHERFKTNWPNENTIEIFRDSARYDSPIMRFVNIHVSGIGDIVWSPENVLSDGKETHDLPIQGGSTKAILPKGASISQHFSYTFSKTQSLLDATQNTIKEEINAKVGTSTAPVSASIDLSVQQQYTTTFGHTETETTTVGDDLTLTGPGIFKVQASRGIKRARRRINSPMVGNWGIIAYYYGHALELPDVDTFNEMIEGRAPDNVGVFPDTLGGETGYSFAQWARSIGQLGSDISRNIDNLDEFVEYSPTYDATIQVIKEKE